MATTEVPERKARKSVAFDDQKLVIDGNGSVSMVSSPIDDTKDTAMSHAPTPGDGAEAPDSGLDPTLLKKKKKKPKKEEEAEDDGEEGTAAADDGGLDLTLKKKKKKKKMVEGEDAFAAKLAALDMKDGEEGEDGEADVDEGDMDKGTGVWQHDETVTQFPFHLLLRRFYKQLEERNPDHATSGSRNYKIPPPQCLREGNKKTIFANIVDISKRMKRSDEHVTAYLFAELGTSGSTDGSRRLVIRGRFQQKQIENVLRKYIIEYVTCRTCRSPDTTLEKGENRLSFITCQSCGSRRSVAAIKTGFSAQVGKRKKMKG